MTTAWIIVGIQIAIMAWWTWCIIESRKTADRYEDMIKVAKALSGELK